MPEAERMSDSVPTKVHKVFKYLACVDTMRVMNTKMLADMQR